MTSVSHLNKILDISRSKIAEEISAFLGSPMEIPGIETESLRPDADWSPPQDKIVITSLAVEGDRKGRCFLCLSPKAALYLGGTLLMIPASEIKERLITGDIDEEIADAFGEIANIIAGVYTSVFAERWEGRLHFIKESQLTVTTYREALENDLIPAMQYLLVDSPMRLDENSLGNMQLFVPENLFEEEIKNSPTEPVPESAGEVSDKRGEKPACEPPEEASPPVDTEKPKDPPLIVLVVEDDRDLEPFIPVLEENHLKPFPVKLQDNLKESFGHPNLRGVFLILREVGEQGFAAAIKIRAAVGNSVPLIAAGPQWTKRTVLQAVKYGICDILVIPADPQEIRKKISTRLHSEVKKRNPS